MKEGVSWIHDEEFLIDIDEIDFHVKGRPLYSFDIGGIIVIKDNIYILHRHGLRYTLNTKITIEELLELEAFLSLLIQAKKEGKLFKFNHDLLIKTTKRDNFESFVEIKCGSISWKFNSCWLELMCEKVDCVIKQLLSSYFDKNKLKSIHSIFDGFECYEFPKEFQNDFLMTICKYDKSGQLELRTTGEHKLEYNVIFPTHEFNGTIKAHTKSDFKKSIVKLRNLF